MYDGKDGYLLGAASSRFYNTLEKAMLLAMQHVSAPQHFIHACDARMTVSWNIATQRP